MGTEWFHNLREGGIPRTLSDGIRARVFPGTHVMLSVVEIEPWSESPVHAHANEQWGVCLEGEWIRIQDGIEYRVEAGDFWETPPHIPHGGRALGGRCLVLDIFAPPREDYRRAGSGYGDAAVRGESAAGVSPRGDSGSGSGAEVGVA
jgi:quercetin dioxygenase-like cupin family protein